MTGLDKPGLACLAIQTNLDPCVAMQGILDPLCGQAGYCCPCVAMQACPVWPRRSFLAPCMAIQAILPLCACRPCLDPVWSRRPFFPPFPPFPRYSSLSPRGGGEGGTHAIGLTRLSGMHPMSGMRPMPGVHPMSCMLHGALGDSQGASWGFMEPCGAHGRQWAPHGRPMGAPWAPHGRPTGAHGRPWAPPGATVRPYRQSNSHCEAIPSIPQPL